MIFAAFLLVGFLISYSVKTGKISEKLIFPVLLIIYIVSFLPTLTIPFIIDDLDHLHNLSLAIENNAALGWIWEPYNEHVMPVIKFFYYVSFKNFWINPAFMHLVILTVVTGVYILLYRLIRVLTKSPFIAALAAAVYAGSNLPDFSIFVITDSHIHFSVFFLLLLFNAQYEYFSSQRKIWLWAAFASAVLAPLCFGLAHISIIAAFLFEKYGVPDEYKKGQKTSLIFILSGWFLGMVPYVVNLSKIVMTAHYRDIGSVSAFDHVNILVTVQNLAAYIYQDLIPLSLPNLYLSMGLFFLAAAAGWKYRKELSVGKIVFILFLGFSTTLLVYILRSQWGTVALQFSRYDVFPWLSLCMLYALILAKPWQKLNAVQTDNGRFLALLLCFFIFSCGSANRYQKAEAVASETNQIIQVYYLSYYMAFTNYFREVPAQSVRVKRNYLNFSPSVALTNKKGKSPLLTRYSRQADFFASFLLPKDIRERIIWTEDTSDEAFVRYLTTPSNISKYVYFLGSIK